MKIEIDSANFETRNGKSKSGSDYTIHRQEAYLHGEGKYPVRFRVPVPLDGQGKPLPYEPGFYDLAPSSYQVGQYDDLEINRFEMKLVKLSEVKPVSKAA